jgi:hypothetical protein
MKDGTSLTQDHCGRTEVDGRQGALEMIWMKQKRVVQLGNVFCATNLDTGTPYVPLSTQQLQRRRLTVGEATEEGVGGEEIEGDSNICNTYEVCFNL